MQLRQSLCHSQTCMMNDKGFQIFITKIVLFLVIPFCAYVYFLDVLVEFEGIYAEELFFVR